VHLRFWFLTITVVGALIAAAAVAALVAWPKPAFRAGGAALAAVSLPGYAGHISSVRIVLADGSSVPATLRDGKIWPVGKLSEGETVQVEVTASRPAWAAWLVGARSSRELTLTTPSAQLRGSWLQVKSGSDVEVGFSAPVAEVAFGRSPPQPLSPPSAYVPTDILASGPRSAGSLEIAAAARSWELLPAPRRVTWFPALARPQVLVEPRLGSALVPDQQIKLTFSQPIATVLGSAQPKLSPSTPGHWRLLDAHTLTFTPSGNGFGLGEQVEIGLGQAVIPAGQSASSATSTLTWQVPLGSTLRLQQLLATLGYLPLSWQATSATPQTARQELAAALNAPSGHFHWRYADTPPSLKALWQAGQSNEITRAAVMSFEHNSGLAVDGIAGPLVWHQLLDDTTSGSGKQSGYSYVFVHRTVPQSLNLWVDGKVILSSPGNTGVPEAPTALGTFAVFEHIPIGTMSGTNPDGSHYHDVGIRWISYFHHGEAIHSFNRASYGTPQSLGCVELPIAAAAKVWPYTPIGTLVTIEN
jgi:peptidoglycan hydrolase-like protein with peptidoglycan-binding domain